MHRILFWSDAAPPDPWVDKARTFPKHAVRAVIKHLKAGEVHGEGSDQSCLLCGLAMPAMEMTDGSVVWPALAQHYVMAHKVWSPQHAWLAERLLLHVDTQPPHLAEETSMSEDTSTPDDPWDVDLIDPPAAAPAVEPEPDPDVLDAEDIGEARERRELSDLKNDSAPQLTDPRDTPVPDLPNEPVANPWDLPDDALNQVVHDKPEPRPRPKRAAPSHGQVQRRRRNRRPARTGPMGPAATLPSSSAPSAPAPAPTQMVVSGGGASSAAAEICAAYPRVSPQLAAKIVSVASAVGAHPGDLANIIHFESNQTFDPAIRNPRSGSVGLIQFDPGTTPHELGITVDQLASLSAQDQMDWVQVKLDRARNGHALNTPHRLAMAVFFPAAVLWPEQQPLPPAVVAANSGISSSFDYLGRMAALARMPGSMPYPPPQYPQSMPQGVDGQQQGGGLFDGVFGFFKNLFGPGQPPGSAPSQAPHGSPHHGAPPPSALPGPVSTARFETDPSLQIRLVEANGTSHGPGELPPGNYRMTVWTGQSWQNMGHVDLLAGKSYRAFQEGGRLKLDQR